MKVVDHLESKECAVKKILIDVVREEASLSKVGSLFEKKNSFYVFTF